MVYFLFTIFECTELSRFSPAIKTTLLNSISMAMKTKMKVGNQNHQQGLDQLMIVSGVLL